MQEINNIDKDEYNEVLGEKTQGNCQFGTQSEGGFLGMPWTTGEGTAAFAVEFHGTCRRLRWRNSGKQFVTEKITL